MLGIVKLDGPPDDPVEGEDGWLEGVHYQFKDDKRSQYVRSIGRFLERFERVE